MVISSQPMSRPELYDWMYGDFRDDVPMYISLAESHGTVLECGVGTGRIAIPMARSGKVVYGIDNSSHMLHRLAKKRSRCAEDVRKRLHIRKADMTDFSLGRRFSFVYVPFSTFNFLLTIGEQRMALARIQEHTMCDGVVVFEILSYSYCPDWFRKNAIPVMVKRTVDPRTGESVELWKEAEFDSSRQIVTERRCFKAYDAMGNLNKEETILWKNRFFFLGEMKLLLELSGFGVEIVYGGFAFEPYTHDSEVAVVIARPM